MQHLLPVVKMTQHQGCLCQESGKWRLVAGGWWLLMIVPCQAVLDPVSKVYEKS